MNISSIYRIVLAYLSIGGAILFSTQLQADEPLKKTWTIVNYWSEWCAPCRVEIPMLNDLSKKLESSEVVVVGVNFDEDPHPLTLEIADTLGIQFPVLTTGEVSQLGLRPPDVLPTTYILNPSNAVAAKLIGEQSEQELLDQLVSLGISISNE